MRTEHLSRFSDENVFISNDTNRRCPAVEQCAIFAVFSHRGCSANRNQEIWELLTRVCFPLILEFLFGDDTTWTSSHIQFVMRPT